MRRTLTTNRSAHFIPLLASVLSSTKFSPHEFTELVVPDVQDESLAAAANPIATAIDAAHQVAFRRGLGNSLYASSGSPVKLEDVKSYAQNVFSKSNIAVIGQGISTEALASAVNSAFGTGSAGASSVSSPASAYYGGEARIPFDAHHNPSAQPTLVLAYGASGAVSTELRVLPHLLGGQSAIKWSPGLSPLAQAAAKVQGASVRSFISPYSDASLFTIVIQAPTDAGVRTVAQEVAAAVKAAGSGVKDDELKRAIAKANFAEANRFDTASDIALHLAPSLLAGASSQAVSFDSVSASGLSKAAEKLFSSKPTVVAVGNTHVLPYA